MLFSIPYNGSNPDEYLEMIEPYSDKIHDIFFGSYRFQNHQQHDTINNLTCINPENPSIEYYESNIIEFLKKSSKYKRYITVNNTFYPLDDSEMEYLIMDLRRYIKDNGIDGVIISEYRQAHLIHQLIPEVEICTSCNSYHTNTRVMDLYRSQGVSLFNPPREVGRSPNLLKFLKSYPLKVLVNESCLFGCPQAISHSVNCSLGYSRNFENCLLNNLSNIFRSNYILPRWLNKLDKYVDVFKLAGRFLSNSKLKIIFDAYFNEKDDYLLTDILVNGTARQLRHLNTWRVTNGKTPIEIYCYDVPDEVLVCECKHCGKCHICEDKMKEILCHEKIS